MPDFLTEKFRELPRLDLPSDVHDKIMTRVVSSRFGHAFATILALLFTNLAVATTFLIIRMVHNDAFSFINFMVKEFELSGNYFNQFWTVLYQNIPNGLFLAVLLNIILIGYIFKFRFLFKNAGRVFFKV